MNDVTTILNALEQGDRQAADRLLPLVYDELRRLAAARLAQEEPGHTLQPTALVHEAYLRLVGGDESRRWQGAAHFFAAAAEAMRRILIDAARRRRRLKRGGALARLSLESCEPAAPEPAEQVLAVDAALEKLAAVEPEVAQLVRLRYFAGLTVAEAARTLDISPRTADVWWAYARAWFQVELLRPPT
jgi:RNA polymerase sigma factor (TIGR02999 family)